MRLAYKDINRNQSYSLEKSIGLTKSQPLVKFDQMCDISLNLNIDPRKTEQNLRGVLVLPHGNGKTLRVAVFAKGNKAEEARAAGADLVGAEDLIEKIQQGEMPFDRCIATPDMMILISKVAKILGPRGLMPNPKVGTVTLDISTAVTNAKNGAVEYRTEKGGIIHLSIGRLSFPEEKLQENIVAAFSHIAKNRPAGVKGTFVKKMTLSSTMGIGIKVDLTTVQQ